MTRSRARTGVVLAVVAAVALAGCSLGPGTSPTATTTEEQVPDGDAAAAAYEGIGNVTAEIELSVRHGDRTSNATLDLAAELGTRNIRQRVTAPARQRGNVFVSNDDGYWRYNASRDVAAKYPHGEGTFRSAFGTDRETFAAFLEAAFDAAADDESGTVSDLPEVGVGPAPTVPGGEDGDGLPAETTANVSEFAVTYEGTGSAAGRPTHVLVVEPANESGVGVEDLTITYHVDQETYFPVRVVREARIDGEPWRHEMTFSDVEYDADVQASTYRFEPDESTRVLDYADGVVTFQTKAALASNASVPLPEADLPEGFEFQYGAGIELDTSGAQLIYSNGSAALVAGRYVDDGIVTSREREVAENVTVDGNRALYVEIRRTQAVYVYCGEHVVSAAAVGEVPRETLFEVAASIECAGNRSGSLATATEAFATATEAVRLAAGPDEGTSPVRTPVRAQSAPADWTPSRSGLAVQRVDDARQAGELRATHR